MAREFRIVVTCGSIGETYYIQTSLPDCSTVNLDNRTVAMCKYGKTIVLKAPGIGPCNILFDGGVYVQAIGADNMQGGWENDVSTNGVEIVGGRTTAQIQLSAVAEVPAGGSTTIDLTIPALWPTNSRIIPPPSSSFASVIDFSWYGMPKLDTGTWALPDTEFVGESTMFLGDEYWNLTAMLVEKGVVVPYSPAGYTVEYTLPDWTQDQGGYYADIWLSTEEYAMPTGLVFTVDTGTCNPMYADNPELEIKIPFSIPERGEYIVIPVLAVRLSPDYLNRLDAAIPNTWLGAAGGSD